MGTAGEIDLVSVGDGDCGGEWDPLEIGRKVKDEPVGKKRVLGVETQSTGKD